MWEKVALYIVWTVALVHKCFFFFLSGHLLKNEHKVIQSFSGMFS